MKLLNMRSFVMTLVAELTNYEEGDEKYEEISDAINKIDIRIIMLKEEIEELEIYAQNK